MRQEEKFSLLGVEINPVDYETAMKKILQAAEDSRPFLVTALAVHGLIEAFLNKDYAVRLNSFDLVLPDGQPIKWSLNFRYGFGLKDRVYGPELTLRLCEVASQRGLPVFFYGSRPEVIEKLVDNLRKRFPALVIAGAMPSRFTIADSGARSLILQEIRSSGAKLLFVGLGCPRQEIWTWENADDLGMPVVAVGAAFDFHAGTVSQAPSWMQKRGLEWFYRLLQEPRRLWKRYLVTNSIFLVAIFLEFLGLKNFQVRSGKKIGEEGAPARIGYS